MGVESTAAEPSAAAAAAISVSRDTTALGAAAAAEPGRWAAEGAEAMEHMSSQELMAICDDHWDALAAATTLEASYAAQSAERYNWYVLALNELAQRGPEIRDWCRRLLVHPDYDARECGAFLLGQLGQRRQLGDAEVAVVTELGALTQQPVEEDCKELQAVDAAIGALAEIGHPAGIPFLRAVLFSEDEWLSGDSQWSAADTLGRLVGQPFMEAADPVGAARAWLRADPG